MGKIEDMRRVREQQFAEAAQRDATAAKAKERSGGAKLASAKEADVTSASAKSEPAETPKTSAREAASAPPEPASRERKAEPKAVATKGGKSSKSSKSEDEQGKCPSCGKVKPVSNGVMASHQKGFGKACPGSRKPPV